MHCLRVVAALLVAGLGLLLVNGPLPAAKDAPGTAAQKGNSETIKLFNGTDLAEWEGHKKLWSVHDGVIVAKNTQPIKVSTYLLTKRKFTDFRLTATVKLVESE